MLLRVVLGVTPREALAAARRALRVGSSFAPHILSESSEDFHYHSVVRSPRTVGDPTVPKTGRLSADGVIGRGRSA
jgi:hypothetical protein